MNGEAEDEREVGAEGAVETPDGQSDEADAEQQEERPPRRSQRRRIVKAKSEELGDWAFFRTHEPGEPYEVVLRGEGIGGDAGSATKIGTAILRIARLLEDLVPRGEVQMQSLAFGNSVRISFRPSKAEEGRAKRELEHARRLVREREEVAKEPDTLVIRLTLQRALTNIQLATALAADLLDTTVAETPEHAVRLGTAVAQTYKSLANTIAREHLTVALEAPERTEPATLSPRKARACR